MRGAGIRCGGVTKATAGGPEKTNQPVGSHDFEDGVWAGMIPLFHLLDDTARQALAATVLEREPDLFADVDVDAALHELFAAFDLYNQPWARVPVAMNLLFLSFHRRQTPALDSKWNRGRARLWLEVKEADGEPARRFAKTM